MASQQSHIQKKGSQSVAATSTSSAFQSRPFEPPQPEIDQAIPSAPISNGHSLASTLRVTPPGVQAKLTIGQPNDKYEQEADQVAAQVVSRLQAPEPVASLQSVISRAELVGQRSLEDKLHSDTVLQQRSDPGGQAASETLEASIAQARGGGEAISSAIRQPMEEAFGANFSGVRIHTDARADQLSRSIQAKAFTTGQDVFFRQGEYSPNSPKGQELLAHELTHTIQQGASATINAKFSTPAGNTMVQCDWRGFKTGVSAGAAKLRVKMGGAVKDGKTVDEVIDPATVISARLRQVLKKQDAYSCLMALRDYNTLLANAEDEIAFESVKSFFSAHEAIVGKIGDQPTALRSGINKEIGSSEKVVRKSLLKSRLTDLIKSAKERLKPALDYYNAEHARNAVADPQAPQQPTDQEVFESHGVTPTQFTTANLEGNSEPLGSGSVNTVYKHKYQNQQGAHVFKPDDEVNSAYGLDAGTQVGIPAEKPEFAKRAVAASRLDQLLGSNIITKTDFAVQDGQFGTVSALAPGSNMGKLSQYADAIQQNHAFQSAMSKLQLLDIICGQVDRHRENYFVQVDQDGNFVKLTGIDNDMAFGAKHTDIDQKIGKGRNKYDSNRSKWGNSPNLGRMGGSKHLEQIGYIDPGFAQVIINFDVTLIKDALQDLLKPEEIDATIQRVQQLKQFLRDAQNQELAKTLAALNQGNNEQEQSSVQDNNEQEQSSVPDETEARANELVSQYKELKAAENWAGAYAILKDLRKRLNRLESSSLGQKQRTDAIGDLANVDYFTKEMVFVSQKLNLPDVQDAPVAITAQNTSAQAKVLWDYLSQQHKATASRGINYDKEVLNRIWDLGDATVRQRMIAVLGTRKDQLKMSNLGYIMEAIHPNHSMVIMGKVVEWYDSNIQQPFFDWVEDQPTPESNYKAAYMQPTELASARVHFEGGSLCQKSNDQLKPLTTGKDWIVVLSSDNQFYGKPKVRPSNDQAATQHSSFLNGLPVESAGTLEATSGQLLKIQNHSGHYTPKTRHLVKMYLALEANGVNMANVEVEDGDMLKGTDGKPGKFKGSEFLDVARDRLRGN